MNWRTRESWGNTQKACTASLARELSEVKSSFSNALKELEKERKSRELLEDLCDEFAKGIRDYQQEVHALKQKSNSDWAGRADHDLLILHFFESWLDERMQTKLVELHQQWKWKIGL